MLRPLRPTAIVGLSSFLFAAPSFAQCGWGLTGQVSPPAQHASSSLLHFARSLALDGTRAVAGSPAYSSAYPAAGQAAVYQWIDQQWQIESTLDAGLPLPGDDFGRAVALRGTLAVVGAPLAGVGGAVSIFRLTFDQGWVLEGEWPGPAGSGTGRSVAIGGSGGLEFVLAGAPELGVLHVLEHGEQGWSLASTLMPPDDDDPPTPSIGFASSLSADGARVLIGDPNEESVFLFEHGAGGWFARAEIEVPLGFEDDGFGTAVALAGSSMLVGAPGEEVDEPGAVFVLSESSGMWSFAATLQPTGNFGGAEFGRAVALSSTTAMVGAPKSGGGLGAAFVYDALLPGWPVVETVAPKPTGAKGQFGSAVATSGPLALASIGLDEIGLFGYSGAQSTYVGGAWGVSNTSTSCEPYLLGYPSQVSATLGGEHAFHLSAGAAGPGSAYLVLGSMSGTAPGVALGDALLPLQPDVYFDASLSIPNQGIFSGTLGVFGPSGTSYGAVTIPSALPGLAGITLYHALVVLGPAGALSISKPSALALVP
jgi:FG-GAP repeat